MTRPVTSLADRLRAQPDATDAGLRELMAVREIVHAFLTAERAEDVYQFALDRVSPLVGATLACLYLIDEGSELMRLAAAHNWPDRYARFLGDMRVRLGSGPSGTAASQRRVVEVLDIENDPALSDWRDVARELNFDSLVALPLQTGDAVLGAVAFYFASSRTVGRETRHLMRLVADQMAATAEKARLIDHLRASNTALSASNAALEQQNADLVEARRVKDEFLATISHELRTPLTAVVGYISLMQEGVAGPITDEQQDTLEQVKEASDQLLSLIGDLLDLASLKRGSVAASIADVDPREPLRDAIAASGGPRKGVTFEVSQPEIMPTTRSDSRTVAKVLRAMLDNAFKFTKQGHVRVTVQIDHDRVIYAIEDTGIGIPGASRDVVFEEFRQVDGGMTREHGGAGMGLALARRRARLVDGEITFSSTPGVGSTFKLELPLRHGGEHS